MNRPRRNRRRIGSLLVVAAGLLAMVGALASFALAKDGNRDRSPDRSAKRHHHRHHHHHAPAGTIQSFDPETDRLVILLSGGDAVGGLVTDRTKIRCEDEHAPDISFHRHGEEEPGDDNGGHGEEEPGDDHGDHGEEPGDDHGSGDNSGPGSSHSDGGPSGHDDNGAGANCTRSDLIPGTVVQEAELELEHGMAIFEEVELDD